MRKMDISLPLLFLFIDSTVQRSGNFGIFTACFTKNNSLRLDCIYAHCPQSPSFSCKVMTSNGSVLNEADDEKCKFTLPDSLWSRNKTTIFNCTLTRNKREEVKHITIDAQRKGKQRIKPCPATTGLLLHRAPSLLWPVVMLSLWRVLITDSQTT